MVEIRIDTKRDSPEEIRQAIAYLQTVIGDSPNYESTPSEEPSHESAQEMFSMFEQTTEQEIPSDLDVPESSSSEEATIEIVEF